MNHAYDPTLPVVCDAAICQKLFEGSPEEAIARDWFAMGPGHWLCPEHRGKRSEMPLGASAGWREPPR